MHEPRTSKRTPSVAVIIPAYNQATYASEAIESVLRQVYTDFELLVVDDGSTDQTPQVLASFSDPRLRVVRQPNGGLSAARNTGLRESTAPLVSFLDSDDFYFPEKLALEVGFLNEHPDIGMVSGGTQIVDQKSSVLKTIVEPPSSLALPELLFGNPFTVSAIVVRRSWIDRVGVFDETLRACEDWDLWHRLAYAGCKFAWIEQPVVAYRYHQGQMTRESDRMRKALLTVLDKFFRQSGLPEHLKACQNKAYASALIHAAAFAYHSNEFDKGQRDLGEAICLDTTLKDQQYKRLVEMLTGWANDPRSPEPVEYLQRIIQNPPQGHPLLIRALRRAKADAWIGPLFQSSRKELRSHRQELLKAIVNKPQWLLNRGVLRMVVNAWLPLSSEPR